MNAFFIACGIALFAFVPVPTLQALLATAASTLFESTPFILAGALLAGAAPRWASRIVPLLGCGCAGGRPARSLPVAIATALSFGPLTAALRFSLAWLPIRGKPHGGDVTHAAFGAGLTALLAPALLCAVANAALQLPHSAPFAFAVLTAACVFAPCGFGALAFAIALRHISAPLAVFALVAGGYFKTPRFFVMNDAGHDAAAYAMSALACALLALHHGSAFVNPRFTPALWASALVLAILAFRHRRATAAAARYAPALMLLAVFGAAPPPVYAATESSFQDSFTGEHLEFTGVLVRDGTASELVRYAITCCRADAQPVSVILARDPAAPAGTWIHASGVLRRSGERFVLDARTGRVKAPQDPFLYR